MVNFFVELNVVENRKERNEGDKKEEIGNLNCLKRLGKRKKGL